MRSFRICFLLIAALFLFVSNVNACKTKSGGSASATPTNTEIQTEGSPLPSSSGSTANPSPSGSNSTGGGSDSSEDSDNTDGGSNSSNGSGESSGSSDSGDNSSGNTGSGDDDSSESNDNSGSGDDEAITVTVTMTITGASNVPTGCSVGGGSGSDGNSGTGGGTSSGTGTGTGTGTGNSTSSAGGGSGNSTSNGGGGSGNSTSNGGTHGNSTNFAGSNLYYAAGLSADQRKTYLSALQSANMKVLRIWLDGQGGDPKGTKITSYPSLEPDTPGTYNDQVLELYDDFMIDAHSYGIKLMISMHSFNSLQAGNDAYKKWGKSNFYTDSSAMEAFDNRIKHVMSHQHKALGKPWSELSDYIFAIETQNEAMIGDGESFVKQHADWQCGRAKAMKSALGNSSSILITTGGESWLDESMQPQYLECEELDIVAIHIYGTGDFSTDKMKSYVEKAQQANKMLIVQEWGVCYHQDSSNQCQTGGGSQDPNRNSILKKFAGAITDAGIPWLYWQAIPNKDPHSDWDFEIGIIDDDAWETLKEVSQEAAQAKGAFDFSKYLL